MARNLPNDPGKKHKEALIIHPKLSVYAGAEYLCLYACKILQELGYSVDLLSDVFDRRKVEELYEMGDVLSKCRHIVMPTSKTRLPRILVPLERLIYTLQLVRYALLLRKTSYSIVLSTQSSIFSLPGKKLYHFVYEVSDLFRYPMPLVSGSLARGGAAKRAYFALLRTLYTRLAGAPKPLWFFVTGRRGVRIMETLGHKNSSFFYPPSRVLDVKPKVKQIVQSSRIAPEKRIELFFEVARKLPQYKFYLIGKDLPVHRLSNPGYAKQLLAMLPSNIVYRGIQPGRPTILEESKVYFHTGLELGMLNTLVEAMSAGCILVVPEKSVAGELVRDSGVGYQYDGVEEAVNMLKAAMEGSSPWTPSEIAKQAEKFGPVIFERIIKRLVSSSGEDAAPLMSC